MRSALNIPAVTKNLIIINALFFLATLVFERMGIDLNQYLGLHFFLADDFNVIQLVTYMFMHGGFTHLFFNMFAVYMFGRTLEYVWGPKRFLFYYIVCGIGAGLVQELVQYISLYPDIKEGFAMIEHASGMVYKVPVQDYMNLLVTVGASGAVYGILLAFGMLFPNQALFIIPFPFPIKAKYFVMGYAALELYLGFSNNPSDNVAHFAHLGGMIFGFILIMYWRKKNNSYGGYTYWDNTQI